MRYSHSGRRAAETPLVQRGGKTARRVSCSDDAVKSAAAYTARAAWVCIAIAAGIASLIIASVTPPFQSPDEFYHVKAAYLLSQADRPAMQREGFSTGGMIDSGLVEYTRLHNETQKMPSGQVSPEARDKARMLRWTGTKEFAECPIGYLPAVYLPQAGALWVGQFLGLTVESSYRLSRLAVTCVFVILCSLAYWIHAPPPLAVAVTVLPMTLFQASAASIDGIAIGAAVLAVSAFLRIVGSNTKPSWLMMILIGALCVLIPCRPFLIPLAVLPLVVLPSGRARWVIIPVALLPVVATMAWTASAVVEIVDLRPAERPPLSDVLAYYLAKPRAVADVLIATASDARELGKIARSFVGTLGWMDTPLRNQDYVVISAMLAVAAVLSVDANGVLRKRAVSRVLALCALGSAALVFVSIWLLWSPHPTIVIYGVQGRYFAIPIILCAYVVGPASEQRRPTAQWAGVVVVALLLVISFTATTGRLKARHARDLAAQARPHALCVRDEPGVTSVLALASSCRIVRPIRYSIQSPSQG